MPNAAVHSVDMKYDFGIILGSNDNNTKFWARNRPGDTQDDIFGLSSFTGIPAQATSKESKADNSDECQQEPVIPGNFVGNSHSRGLTKAATFHKKQ